MEELNRVVDRLNARVTLLEDILAGYEQCFKALGQAAQERKRPLEVEDKAVEIGMTKKRKKVHFAGVN